MARGGVALSVWDWIAVTRRVDRLHRLMRQSEGSGKGYIGVRVSAGGSSPGTVDFLPLARPFHSRCPSAAKSKLSPAPTPEPAILRCRARPRARAAPHPRGLPRC